MRSEPLLFTSSRAMEELVCELRLFLDLLDREYLSAGVREKKMHLSNILHRVLSDKEPSFKSEIHSGLPAPPQMPLPEIPHPWLPPNNGPPPLPSSSLPEGYYEEAVPLSPGKAPEYITANYDSDAMSSSYESYDEEEEDGKGQKMRHQWPSAEASMDLVKDARICAFLLRKKRFGQWTKLLCVIKDNKLLCYKSSKDHTPQMELTLTGCSITHIPKDGKKKKHELKIVHQGADALVLAVHSKEQAEEWLKVTEWRDQAAPSLPGGLEWGKEGLIVLGGFLGTEGFQAKNWEGVKEKLGHLMRMTATSMGRPERQQQQHLSPADQQSGGSLSIPQREFAANRTLCDQWYDCFEYCFPSLSITPSVGEWQEGGSQLLTFTTPHLEKFQDVGKKPSATPVSRHKDPEVQYSSPNTRGCQLKEEVLYENADLYENMPSSKLDTRYPPKPSSSSTSSSSTSTSHYKTPVSKFSSKFLAADTKTKATAQLKGKKGPNGTASKQKTEPKNQTKKNGVNGTNGTASLKQNGSNAEQCKYGKNRVEADAKRLQAKEEELMKKKQEIRNHLTQLKKERIDLRTAVEAAAGKRSHASLSERLKKVEEDCRQKEEQRVNLELELSEVKESLKKALSGGVTLGLTIEPKTGSSGIQSPGTLRRAQKSSSFSSCDTSDTESCSLPVNSASLLRRQQGGQKASPVRGHVLRKAKEWEQKTGT
ncbi:actin filament-associated protein 1 [Anarrhichthys ocellatus]|uniref:actin filament-associated protein 1 n=1 Tax=Anarrhichthys ocellatus TaxID=433405 RepID=UPI0012ECD862|nr:actin filament-associated protein 1 [Anarrhichthys ocellatus]